MSYFPILLDLTDMPCLVAGGGRLGVHKAEALLCSGANVTVISPEICPELEALPVTILRREVRKEDVQGMLLVVDATGNAEAEALLSDACRLARIPFNSACRVSDGSAIFPAVYRHGRTVLAVSTLGASPAASSLLRDTLADHIPEEMDGILDTMADLRPLSREAFPSQPQRRAFLRRCLHEMIVLSRPLSVAETDAIINEYKEKDPE